MGRGCLTICSVRMRPPQWPVPEACGRVCRKTSSCPDGFPSEEVIRRRILSEPHRSTLLTRLQKLHSVADGKRDRPIEAGVLMPLCIVDDRLSLLLTVRSAHLSNHAGQVSFPGGRVDQSDGGVEEAALRETEEELGIPRSSVEIWTKLRTMPDRAGRYNVTPVLGYAGELNLNSLKINEEEVSHVFAVSLNHLLSPENRRYTTFGNGYRLPVFTNSAHRIWGLSATAIDMFLANSFPDLHNLVTSKRQFQFKPKP